ncbi:Hypothetical Protein FCC1311_006452 [Hondaea fermentalgiana]|uniref:Uncharacterized protein n=1 Tax=Hondaea fermentalgiana TaxID=2315210 RepID=A0A2R5G075_9STRA|nr:Hypothetical Protein FCC1311_006452 [Hondaea fermentalgiana]|eukprot:GBG24427.1 Hypothetical Protein FCC1311_006452 [Hondaea fermentalgiana]
MGLVRAKLLAAVLLAALATTVSAAAESRSMLDAAKEFMGIVEIDMGHEERDLQSVPSGCNYGWNLAGSNCCSRLCSSDADCYLEYSYSGRVSYQCSYRFGMSIGVFAFIVLYWGLFMILLVALICCLRRREQHLPQSMQTLRGGTIFMWVLATLCCGGIGFAVMLCVVVTRQNHNLHKFKGHKTRNQRAFPTAQSSAFHQNGQSHYQQHYPQHNNNNNGQESVPVAQPVPEDGDTDRKKHQEVSMV